MQHTAQPSPVHALINPALPPPVLFVPGPVFLSYNTNRCNTVQYTLTNAVAACALQMPL